MDALTPEKRLAMECVALGCQRAVADDLIQELRARIAELETRLRYRVAVCNCAGLSKCGACQDDEAVLS